MKPASNLGKENPGKAVEEKLKAIVKEIKSKSKVKVEYIYREGSIFDVISEVANEIKANVMILGTHGKKGIQHITGSYAMKVITESPVPVIVVQKRKSNPKWLSKRSFSRSALYTEASQQVFYAIVNSMLFKSEIMIYTQKSSDPGDIAKLKIITMPDRGRIPEEQGQVQIYPGRKHAEFHRPAPRLCCFQQCGYDHDDDRQQHREPKLRHQLME